MNSEIFLLPKRLEKPGMTALHDIESHCGGWSGLGSRFPRGVLEMTGWHEIRCRRNGNY
jgi:hypothetical protein